MTAYAVDRDYSRVITFRYRRCMVADARCAATRFMFARQCRSAKDAPPDSCFYLLRAMVTLEGGVSIIISLRRRDA